ncbi:MAG: 1-acyl-sn-glycerol-3-phosphate acyltransferase [Pseudohongiellaceae bacterium]|jgi:1-acyl-sn-glycerol-3-phosphate acyltransferase
MKSFLLTLKMCVFYIGYILSIIWFGTTGIIFFSFLPYKIRSNYILLWNRFIVFWVRFVCGVKVEVIGKENLPDGPYVVLSNHQSQWETYFLQYFLAPVCIVLKRELLNIPFFGWGLRLTSPIAIDRGSPKQALKKTLEQGKQHLANNISILIFPEGTRTPASKETKYARGGANIAVAANVPVVPIALNAGEFWPAGEYVKYPGTITVKIGKPIASAELSKREITEQAKVWIEAEVEKMITRT